MRLIQAGDQVLLPAPSQKEDGWQLSDLPVIVERVFSTGIAVVSDCDGHYFALNADRLVDSKNNNSLDF